MAFNEELAQRIREEMAAMPGYSEKKMFGGVCFMLDGHMCCGVVNDEMMARVGPERYDEALTQPHARPMDFTGKEMKGYVYVSRAAWHDQPRLAEWVRWCEAFVRRLPAKKPPKPKRPKSAVARPKRS